MKRDYYGDSESIYDSDGTIATSQGDHDSSRTQKKRQRINLREKKATELMASLALPAAIQAQMTSATVGGNQGLTDIKMRRVNYLLLPRFSFPCTGGFCYPTLSPMWEKYNENL